MSCVGAEIRFPTWMQLNDEMSLCLANITFKSPEFRCRHSQCQPNVVDGFIFDGMMMQLSTRKTNSSTKYDYEKPLFSTNGKNHTVWSTHTHTHKKSFHCFLHLSVEMDFKSVPFSLSFGSMIYWLMLSIRFFLVSMWKSFFMATRSLLCVAVSYRPPDEYANNHKNLIIFGRISVV